MVLEGITHLCIVACIIQFMLFGHWHLTLNFGKALDSMVNQTVDANQVEEILK